MKEGEASARIGSPCALNQRLTGVYVCVSGELKLCIWPEAACILLCFNRSFGLLYPDHILRVTLLFVSLILCPEKVYSLHSRVSIGFTDPVCQLGIRHLSWIIAVSLAVSPHLTP